MEYGGFGVFDSELGGGTRGRVGGFTAPDRGGGGGSAGRRAHLMGGGVFCAGVRFVPLPCD